MSNLDEVARVLGDEGAPPRPPETGFISTLRRIDRALAWIEETGLTICLATLILLGVTQVGMRKWYPPTPVWMDEILRYSVFFLGLIGAALAAQSDRLFNIDMMTRLLSKRGRLMARIVCGAFTIYICYWFFAGSLELRQAILDEEGEIIRPALGILSLPVAVSFISIHIALHMAIDLYYLVTGKPSPDIRDVPHAS